MQSLVYTDIAHEEVLVRVGLLGAALGVKSNQKTNKTGLTYGSDIGTGSAVVRREKTTIL